MTMYESRELSIDLGGKAAIDTTIDELTGAIERSAGQPVTLSISESAASTHGQTVVGLQDNPLYFEVSGSQDTARRLFYPGTRRLYEGGTRGGAHAQSPADATVNGQRLSRALFLDAEVKPDGRHARLAVESVVEIHKDSLATSGIDFSDVSGSQARRLVESIRDDYRNGYWQSAIQTAVGAPYFGQLVELTKRDRAPGALTVSDSHIEQVLGEEYRTDIELLTIRALKIGIKELQSQDRTAAASHGVAWLSMLEDGLTLDKFTPEVTVQDVLRYPSYLNPRPDKGVPELSPVAFMVGSEDSRNYTIKYPNGDVYAVDYPYGQPRPLANYPTDGFAGNVAAGTLDPATTLVHAYRGWTDFPKEVAHSLTRHAIHTLAKTHEGLTREQKDMMYTDLLHEAAGATAQLPYQTTTKVAAGMLIANTWKIAQTNPAKAYALFDFALGHYMSKGAVEDETGVSLSLTGVRIEGLDFVDTLSVVTFRDRLWGATLATWAELYAGHPELSTRIKAYRKSIHETESRTTYYQEMAQLAQTSRADFLGQSI